MQALLHFPIPTLKYQSEKRSGCTQIYLLLRRLEELWDCSWDSHFLDSQSQLCHFLKYCETDLSPLGSEGEGPKYPRFSSYSLQHNNVNLKWNDMK